MVVPCINAEKEVLTYLPNPNIPELKEKNSKLKRKPFADNYTTKDYLPVHAILGVADFKKIQTSEPIFGKHPEKKSLSLDGLRLVNKVFLVQLLRRNSLFDLVKINSNKYLL